MEPEHVHRLLCDFVLELPRRGIYLLVVVFLTVLPRTGNLHESQVSLEEFNLRVMRFNQLVHAAVNFCGR